MKPFKCVVCCSAFSQKYTLKAHVSSVHEGKMSFKCDLCDSGFFSQNYMCLQFMKKTREFKCVTCAAIFGLMQNLNRHINLVHQENKPCKCKLCTIALTGKTDLNRHISSVHEEKYY